MVNEKVLVKDKYRIFKKIFKIVLILLIIVVVLAIIFFIGFSMKNPKGNIVLENPLKEIVFENTNEAGLVNKQEVVEAGVMRFNAEYINYLIVALGANNLHKSYVGYGNPIIEMKIDGESWTSEISKGTLNTNKGDLEDKDLLITISKQEAVEALLSPDISSFMKSSVSNGNTQIEMVAGKVELGSKGYLAMYKEITGEEMEIEG